ncbi:response regulator [Synechococcales cyanobacterium C]|uniref:histidine kinase n=1 Tax=Petrachloros mirabilis ULC683 TaxID=2781853 RepID=A0A8K1ZVM7_9CYAN|nr:hybrid sensor histidine kinase/response regulator [Petrachloros mirabilis]NCJ04963.1 response regulator [Petrachloros mirabilis ULC683]
MTHTSLPSRSRPSRLLVVDDLPDNLFLVQAMLADEGYEIVLADNGETALALIATTPPDLVLLDVMMPGIDGYEVTRRIRQTPDLGFIPILLLSAHDQTCVVRGLDVGADDFVRKPVEVEELLARVRSLLRLKHSIDERDRIAQQREDFVSRLTHDLRTPLIAADRMLELILEERAFGDLPIELTEALKTMALSNQTLLAMVNNLLQVYRFEAGQQRLHFQSVDLGAIVTQVIQALMPLAQEKQLQIQTQINPQLPPIEGDRLELKRVVTNLLDNAIKFSDRGIITVILDADAASTRTPPLIRLSIEDNGIGIPDAEQTYLFERFHQGQHPQAGNGLGLHLSRYIVEAHHGRIFVRSTPNQGSCFTVELPLVQP